MAKKSKKRNQWSAAAVITLIFLSIVVLGAFIYFGYQTWQFVSFVLPADNLTMKVTALVNFDIMSYLWLAMGLFLGHILRPLARTLCGIAGFITFLLSLICSIIQMAIASEERFLTSIDPNQVYAAQAVVIIALVWNICTVLSIIHIQWPSIADFFGWTIESNSDEETDEDEEYIDEEKAEPVRVTPQTTAIQQKQPGLIKRMVRAVKPEQPQPKDGREPQPVSTPVQSEHIDTARWEAMLREMAEGMKTRMTLEEREAVRQQVIEEYSQQQQQPQNPLQSPQLDTSANQPGTQNGTSNGHQKSQA